MSFTLMRRSPAQAPPPARPLRRRLRVVAVAGLAVVLLGGLAATVWPAHHPAVPVGHRATRPADPIPDVSFVVLSGGTVPISRTAGPRVHDGPTRSGFAHTPRGAAFAAAWLLTATSPYGGPDVYGPTITGQVIGQDAFALRDMDDAVYRQSADELGVAYGTPIPVPGAPSTFAGYRLAPSAAGTQRVHVLVANTAIYSLSGDVVYLDVDLTLSWSGGDWRLVAPVDGDWSTVTTEVHAPSTVAYTPFAEG